MSKRNHFFAVVGMVAILVLTGCNNLPEHPAEQLNITINGVDYRIALPAENPVDLTTLCTEFDAAVVVSNYDEFKSLTIDGNRLKNNTLALPVKRIDKDSHIIIDYNTGAQQGTVVLNTLNSLIPEMEVSGKGEAPGDYYLSFVWLRLIIKCDNAGDILYYRYEPRTFSDVNDDSGWWDFKKVRSTDGETYYCYHANDPKFADRLFMGYDPGMRVIMDDHYHPLDTIHLLPSRKYDVQAGEPLDGHDFYFFSPDHYIVSAYIKRTRQDQDIFACYLQEVENGQVVFDWWSVDHPQMVRWTDPAFGLVRDYVHFNSIQVLPDGNLMCSLRHESTIIKIRRTDGSGEIMWAIHGYDLDEQYAFSGQHYARLSHDTLTLFDNGNGHTPPTTRLMRLIIDPDTGEVLGGGNILPANDDSYFTMACGAFSMQDSHYIAGWGIPGSESGPHDRVLTEYDLTGREVFGIRHTGDYTRNFLSGTYRCVKCK